MMTKTRKDILKYISKRTGYSMSACNEVIKALKDFTMDTLAEGDSVQIKGLVTFSPTMRKARRGYNPDTGEYEIFESVKSVNCAAGQDLKNAVRGIDGDI